MFRFSVMLFAFPGISSCQAHVGSVECLSLNLLGTFRDLSVVVVFFFFFQFNVPFKIISLIETSQSIDGAKREYPGKTT